MLSSINPRGSLFGDGQAPTSIALSGLGAAAGSTLALKLRGDFNDGSGIEGSGDLAFVFLDAAGKPIGPVYGGLMEGDAVSDRALVSWLDTDASGNTVFLKVPAGAVRIAIAPAWGDPAARSDADNDLKVDVTKVSGTQVGTATGFDSFTFGAGSTTVDAKGGDGDVFSFENLSTAVTVTLGADRFTANKGALGIDTVIGLAHDGPDIILGAGNDIVNATAASMTGDEWIMYRPGSGNDRVNGSATEVETLNLAGGSRAVVADLGGGWARDGYGGLDRFTNIDNLYGGRHDDTLMGNDGANRLRGRAGDDLLDGRGGIDTADYTRGGVGAVVNLAAGTATDGEGGTDILLNIENVRGSSFADTITGDADTNQLRAMAGNDRLSGGAGDDELAGGAGNDVLDGGVGFDLVSFNLDSSVGVVASLATGRATGAGTDTLAGIEGIIGSAVADTLTGNASANYFNGLGGNDRIDGGAGVDEVGYYGAPSAVSVNLAAGTATGGYGTDTLLNIENVTGSGFADTLTGSATANQLRGDAGNDTLLGGAGNDRLEGGTGNDILRGQAGTDRLLGGTGADRFVFESAADIGNTTAARDQILDFSAAQADRIDLTLIDASSGVAGNQAFAFIGTAAFSGVAGQLRYVVTSGDAVVYGDVNGDRTADFQLFVDNTATLSAGTFLL